MASGDSEELPPKASSMNDLGSQTAPVVQDEKASEGDQPNSPQTTTDSGASPSEIRENMITTAVKFLLNPQVQNSPLSQRRVFLKKKGLNDEEIRISIERSGVKEPVGSPPAVIRPGGGATSRPGVPALPPPPPPRSVYATARDYASIAVIISGVTYGIYKFFQRFIFPYFKSQKENTTHLQNIEVSVAQLNNTLSATVEEIQKSVALIQTSLEKQEAQLEQLSQDVAMSKTLAAARGGSGDTLQIKQEITSLKGLLLSRHQFPATPQQSSIPSWQRRSSAGSQEGQPENGLENGASRSREETVIGAPSDEGSTNGGLVTVESINGGPATETTAPQLRKSMLENGVYEKGTGMEGGDGGVQNGASLEQNGVNGEGKEAD